MKNTKTKIDYMLLTTIAIEVTVLLYFVEPIWSQLQRMMASF